MGLIEFIAREGKGREGKGRGEFAVGRELELGLALRDGGWKDKLWRSGGS